MFSVLARDDARVGAARALARELAARLQAPRGLGLGQAGGCDFGGGGDALTLSGVDHDHFEEPRSLQPYFPASRSARAPMAGVVAQGRIRL